MDLLAAKTEKKIQFVHVFVSAFCFCYRICEFVCFESLRPRQQFFSHVKTDLPGLNQY